MTPAVEEWVAKAENDFASMLRESRVRKSPNHDIVCFLSQQCAEKYLKGRLWQAGIDLPKTHDLSALLDMALAVEPLREGYRPGLSSLTRFAVRYRYPGLSASKASADKARKFCEVFRLVARQAMCLRTPKARVRSRAARGAAGTRVR